MNATLLRRSLIAAFTVCLTIMPGTSASANASPAPLAPSSMAANPAPTCVALKIDPRGAVFTSYFITNKCTVTQRVKLIFQSSTDTSCFIVDANKTYEHKRANIGSGKFVSMVSC